MSLGRVFEIVLELFVVVVSIWPSADVTVDGPTKENLLSLFSVGCDTCRARLALFDPSPFDMSKSDIAATVFSPSVKSRFGPTTSVKFVFEVLGSLSVFFSPLRTTLQTGSPFAVKRRTVSLMPVSCSLSCRLPALQRSTSFETVSLHFLSSVILDFRYLNLDTCVLIFCVLLSSSSDLSSDWISLFLDSGLSCAIVCSFCVQ